MLRLTPNQGLGAEIVVVKRQRLLVGDLLAVTTARAQFRQKVDDIIITGVELTNRNDVLVAAINRLLMARQLP